MSMKKTIALLLAALFLLAHAACGKGGEPAVSAGKDTPCTDEEIAQVINTGEFLFNEK